MIVSNIQEVIYEIDAAINAINQAYRIGYNAYTTESVIETLEEIKSLLEKERVADAGKTIDDVAVLFCKSKMDGRDVPYCAKCNYVLCYDESIKACNNCGQNIIWPNTKQNEGG